MREIDREKTGPMQVTVKTEEEKISRRGFLKKAAAVGLTAGVLGTGAVVGFNAFEKALSIENPLPDLTSPVPGQPKPSKGPKPENPPPYKSTGEFWNDLGFVNVRHDLPGVTNDMTTGILADVSRRKIDYLGSTVNAWILKVYYDQDSNNNPIFANITLGADRLGIWVAKLVSGEPNLANFSGGSAASAWGFNLLPTNEFVKILQHKIGHQFGFDFMTRADNASLTGDNFSFIRSKIPETKKLISKLILMQKNQGGNIRIGPNDVFYPLNIMLPPAKK